MALKIFEILDEQAMVNFTGRVNILQQTNRELLGVIIVREGDVFRAHYKGVQGLKAFYNIIIETAETLHVDFIVEPEIVGEEDKQIHYPYSVLKNRAQEVLERYSKVAGLRPPPHVKLLAKASILTSEEDIGEAEFQVLCALTEWSKVEDLYRYCPLLDFEITESLVSLRRKNALEVVGSR